MSSTNEPISEEEHHGGPLDPVEVDPPQEQQQHVTVAPQKSKSTLSMRSVASSVGYMRPKKTISKLRRLAVRESALQKIFFPHHDHKMHLVNEHLQKHGKNDDDEFHSGQLNLRGQIVWFIHSKTVQTILLLLLLIDVFVVIAELIIASFKTCAMHVTPGSNDGWCNVTGHELVGGHHSHHFSYLSSSSSGSSGSWGAQNSSGYFPPTYCGVSTTQNLSHELHTAEQVLFWVSIAILCIFALELVTLFLCMCHKFFTPVYMIDVVVVGVSLGLQLGLGHTDGDNAGIGLLIFVRCWRFARILHGFGLTVHEVEEIEEKEEEEEEEELQEKLEEKTKTCAELHEDIADLKRVILDLLEHDSAQDAVNKVMEAKNPSGLKLREIHRERSETNYVGIQPAPASSD